MTRADDYQSYRPSAHDTRRELSIAGQLSDSAWHSSSQALMEFLSRVYKPSEIERALADAVQDKRFGPSGVANQRNNLQLYFTVSRLMQKYSIRQLPWSQRELDRLLDDFAREPSIREIDVDFRSIMHKLIRNGAFDHLAGLTTTIVSTQYLPNVKRLMERRQGEYMTSRPTEARSTSRISDRPTPAPPSVPATKQNAAPKSGAETPKEPTKETAQKPKEPPKEPSKRPTMNKDDSVEQSDAAPQTLATGNTAKSQDAPVDSPRPATSTVAIQGSTTYKAIVQEGLETLSEASMMPFVRQYELFNDVLRMLERSCFFWASRIVPGVLKNKKWAAWQQVSILEWLDYFSLANTPLNISTGTRSTLVDKIIPGLRKMHTDTITRKALPIDAVLATMEHALAIFKILEDGACTAILQKILDSLNENESRSTETRSRLKAEFQHSVLAINQKYMRLMEGELKEKASAMNADLDQHLESCDWRFKFFPPSDDYYQAQQSPIMRPGSASLTTYTTGLETSGATTISASTGSRVGAIPATATEKNDRIAVKNAAQIMTDVSYQSEAASRTVPPAKLGPEVPPAGSLEYEQYWLDHQAQSKGQISVRIIPQALGLNESGWEDFQLAAIKVLEQHDLTDVRSKDQRPKVMKAMQALQDMNRWTFAHIKKPAFADFLCGITFKHVSRTAALEQSRRNKAQHPSVEDNSSDNRDSRTVGHEARLAETSSRLEALKTAPTSTAYQRSTNGYVGSRRPRADEFFDQEQSTVQASAKRSLSPTGDRDDAQKKIKLEPLSQDDLILLDHPTSAEIDSAAFEAAMRSEIAMPSVESCRFPTRGTSFTSMPDRPFGAPRSPGFYGA